LGHLWEVPTRDWLLVLTPVGIFFWFLAHPEQYYALADRVMSLLQ
jgi:hypothetical protein